MQCIKCQHKGVITLQHGSLCKQHFINYFEDKVFKTINKYRLLERSDTLCIATSGGKDSLTVLYLTKKYLQRYQMKNKLFALAVDEGISNYREQTLKDLEEFSRFCGQQEDDEDISCKVGMYKQFFKDWHQQNIINYFVNFLDT